VVEFCQDLKEAGVSDEMIKQFKEKLSKSSKSI
jgi:hypothetical protein